MLVVLAEERPVKHEQDASGFSVIATLTGKEQETYSLLFLIENLHLFNPLADYTGGLNQYFLWLQFKQLS